MAAWWQKTITLGTSCIGISPQSNGYAAARLSIASKRPRLEACHILSSPLALMDLLNSRSWRGLPIHALLAPDQYSVMQLARPDVPEAEMAAAMRWILPDLVDIPIQELQFELFDRPLSARSGFTQQLNVAVCRKSEIRQQAANLGRDARLQSLAIRELALRNLLRLLPEADSSLACLFRLPEGLFLMIIKDSAVFLFRGLLGLDWTAMEEALAQGVSEPADRLLLELQRSLDFYEDQLATSAIGQLLLMPADSEQSGLLGYLSAHLSMQCKAVALTDLVDLPEALSFPQQQALLACVGAVLRGGS